MSPLVRRRRRRVRSYQDPIKVLVAVAMLLFVATLLIMAATGIKLA